jgi:hypothetical protein
MLWPLFATVALAVSLFCLWQLRQWQPDIEELLARQRELGASLATLETRLRALEDALSDLLN